MKLTLWIAILLLTCTYGTISAQESNHSKDIHAYESYLNKKLPKIKIEKWITKKPDTTGKFILYDFWHTGCTWCHKAVPMLNRCAKLFKQDLIIIGVAEQDEKEIREFEKAPKSPKSPKMEFYIACAQFGANIQPLTIDAIPHIKLVSPDGIVIWEGNPLEKNYQLSEDVIKKLILKYKKK